jgi:hypothetical protein
MRAARITLLPILDGAKVQLTTSRDGIRDFAARELGLVPSKCSFQPGGLG